MEVRRQAWNKGTDGGQVDNGEGGSVERNLRVSERLDPIGRRVMHAWWDGAQEVGARLKRKGNKGEERRVGDGRRVRETNNLDCNSIPLWS